MARGPVAGGLFTGAWRAFLAAALAMEPFLGFLSRFKRHFNRLKKSWGVLLVLTGVTFVTEASRTFRSGSCRPSLASRVLDKGHKKENAGGTSGPGFKLRFQACRLTED